MSEGQQNKTSQQYKNIAYVLVILIAAFLYFKAQKPRDIDAINTPHVQTAHKSDQLAELHDHSAVVMPEYDGFNVIINGAPYMMDMSIKVNPPITAHFTHSNPAVTRVRMQYPRDPRMHVFYPVNRDVTIELHSSYMDQGVASYSDFIAEDDAGNAYDKIRLTFLPQ